MSNVSPQRFSASRLVAADNENVVTLPDPSSGRLGELFASAAGPGQSHELSWEFGARTAFNTESQAWSDRQRRVRRSPAVVALVAVSSLLVTTTGFAAATGLPGPAARVVDHVLKHVDLTIQPPEITSAVAQSPSSGRPSSTAAASGSLGQGGGNAASCPSTKHQSVPGSACLLPTTNSVPGGSSSNSARSGKAAVVGKATMSTPNQNGRAARAPSGTGGGEILGAAKGSNHATRRGTGTGGSGSQGTGSGKGTGSNRGGNQGTGSNRGGNQGTGSNRGGNKGTGSNRGGNKGTDGGHHHRGSHHGTAIPDPGATPSGSDSGTG